jgi:hypothetical protein
VFDAYGKDQLKTKSELIPALVGLPDSPWGEWTGLNDTSAPHMVTPSDLGRLLRRFGITSKTLWPPGSRSAETKCDSGYHRQQFQEAWTSWCDDNDEKDDQDEDDLTATAATPSTIRYLRKP